MKTLRCSRHQRRPVIIDISRAMRPLHKGECLQIVAPDRYIVYEAMAYAHMQGHKVLAATSRWITTLVMMPSQSEVFFWDDHQSQPEQEWIVCLRKGI